MTEITTKISRQKHSAAPVLESARWKLRGHVNSAAKSRGYDVWPRITQTEAQALLDALDELDARAVRAIPVEEGDDDLNLRY